MKRLIQQNGKTAPGICGVLEGSNNPAALPSLLLDAIYGSLLSGVNNYHVQNIRSIHSKLPWDKEFDALEAFRFEHGKCFVPWSYNKTLSIWMQHSYKADLINHECMAQLECFGFVWDTHPLKDHGWETIMVQANHCAKGKYSPKPCIVD